MRVQESREGGLRLCEWYLGWEGRSSELGIQVIGSIDKVKGGVQVMTVHVENNLHGGVLS